VKLETTNRQLDPVKEGIHTKEGGKEQTHITGPPVEGHRRIEKTLSKGGPLMQNQYAVSTLPKIKPPTVLQVFLRLSSGLTLHKSLETTFILLLQILVPQNFKFLWFFTEKRDRTNLYAVRLHVNGTILGNVLLFA
jgi:hypothetical protein